MNKKLLIPALLLLTGCSNNEPTIVNEYVEELLDVYKSEYYAYTYTPVYGNFNIEGEDHYLITLYLPYGKASFICWHNEDDIDWEVFEG